MSSCWLFLCLIINRELHGNLIYWTELAWLYWTCLIFSLLAWWCTLGLSYLLDGTCELAWWLWYFQMGNVHLKGDKSSWFFHRMFIKVLCKTHLENFCQRLSVYIEIIHYLFWAMLRSLLDGIKQAFDEHQC